MLAIDFLEHARGTISIRLREKADRQRIEAFIGVLSEDLGPKAFNKKMDVLRSEDRAWTLDILLFTAEGVSTSRFPGLPNKSIVLLMFWPFHQYQKLTFSNKAREAATDLLGTCEPTLNRGLELSALTRPVMATEWSCPRLAAPEVEIVGTSGTN